MPHGRSVYVSNSRLSELIVLWPGHKQYDRRAPLIWKPQSLISMSLAVLRAHKVRAACKFQAARLPRDQILLRPIPFHPPSSSVPII